MNTNPSIDDMLEAVIMGIDDDILPGLGNPKAQATAVMMQSILQGIRQILPDYERRLVEEHNAMLQTLREIGATLGETDGDAADRIRARAVGVGQRDDLPPPLDRGDLVAAHAELGHELEESLLDLDELQRAGNPAADAALQVLRAHLGPRYLRDVATISVGEGFVGRG